MKISDLKQMQDRKPFRPFAIHLTNGDKLPVGHPEQFLLNPNSELFALWVGPEWSLVDVQEIARVSVATRPEKRG